MHLRLSVARFCAAALAAWLLALPFERRPCRRPRASTRSPSSTFAWCSRSASTTRISSMPTTALPVARRGARTPSSHSSALEANARHLADQLDEARPTDPLLERRRRSLHEQLESVRTRLEILRGEHLPFDEEARRIYGVAPPHHDDAFYLAIHRQLDAALPGPGSLGERMDAFKKKFIVPPDRVRDGAGRRPRGLPRSDTRARRLAGG